MNYTFTSRIPWGIQGVAAELSVFVKNRAGAVVYGPLSGSAVNLREEEAGYYAADVLWDDSWDNPQLYFTDGSRTDAGTLPSGQTTPVFVSTESGGSVVRKLQFTYRRGPSLALTNLDAPPVLMDDTGTFGVRRVDNGAVVVAASTPMVQTVLDGVPVVGTYEYVLPDSTIGVDLEWWPRYTYNGAPSSEQRISLSRIVYATSVFHTYNEFVSRFGKKNIAQASNKDSDSKEIDPVALQMSFDVATDEIYAFLRGVYTIPLDWTPNGGIVSARIKRIAMNLAFEDLYEVRGWQDVSGKNKPDVRNKISRLAKDSYQELALYRAGIRQLPAVMGDNSSFAAEAFDPAATVLDIRDPDERPVLLYRSSSTSSASPSAPPVTPVPPTPSINPAMYPVSTTLLAEAGAGWFHPRKWNPNIFPHLDQNASLATQQAQILSDLFAYSIAALFPHAASVGSKIILFWDGFCGQEFPGYAGKPSYYPPEFTQAMKREYTAFCLSHGFRCGECIRPTIRNPVDGSHVYDADPQAVYDAEVAVSVADGCSAWWLDSSLFGTAGQTPLQANQFPPHAGIAAMAAANSNCEFYMEWGAGQYEDVPNVWIFHDPAGTQGVPGYNPNAGYLPSDVADNPSWDAHGIYYSDERVNPDDVTQRASLAASYARGARIFVYAGANYDLTGGGLFADNQRNGLYELWLANYPADLPLTVSRPALRKSVRKRRRV